MDDLRRFVANHSERGACRCGKCVEHPGQDKQPEGHAVDLVFFDVSTKGEPDADELRRLISEARHGEHCDLDPWDGREHSYIEVGGWIGDQGLALMLIGIGTVLGLWPLMTPKMLPGIPDDLVMPMAEQGLVSIMPVNEAASVIS